MARTLTVSSAIAILFCFGCAFDGRGTADQHHCAPQPASSLVVNVKDKGATADDTSDDTAAIQSAIDAVATKGGTVFIPDGTYLINTRHSGNKGLRLASDMRLQLSDGAILKAIPNAYSDYAILYLPAVSDVIIQGGTIVGDRNEHSGTTGESGMGIWIASSSRVYIAGVTIRDCWGDGLYVGGNSGCSTIRLCHVISDHNRRQGLSVVYAADVRIQYSVFSNTGGTLPEAGIDLEPNEGETVSDVWISDCSFTRNAGSGVQCGVAAGNTGKSFIRAVVIEKSTFTDNGFPKVLGSEGAGGIEISNTAGHIVRASSLSGNKAWGIRLRDDADSTVLEGNVVDGTKQDGIYVDPTINDYRITGNTITNSKRYGLYLGPGSNGTASGNILSGNGM